MTAVPLPDSAQPFGSSHLVLRPEAVTRTTFCYPDSNEEPTDFGAAERMGLVPIAKARIADALDDHIEAQAHGEVRIGFRLTVDELAQHPDYRGPEYVTLGRGIAVDGMLNPRIIGEAVQTGRHDPADLKRLWHCLARFGAPADTVP